MASPSVGGRPGVGGLLPSSSSQFTPQQQAVIDQFEKNLGGTITYKRWGAHTATITYPDGTTAQAHISYKGHSGVATVTWDAVGNHPGGTAQVSYGHGKGDPKIISAPWMTKSSNGAPATASTEPNYWDRLARFKKNNPAAI